MVKKSSFLFIALRIFKSYYRHFSYHLCQKTWIHPCPCSSFENFHSQILFFFFLKRYSESDQFYHLYHYHVSSPPSWLDIAVASQLFSYFFSWSFIVYFLHSHWNDSLISKVNCAMSVLNIFQCFPLLQRKSQGVTIA